MVLGDYTFNFSSKTEWNTMHGSVMITKNWFWAVFHGNLDYGYVMSYDYENIICHGLADNILRDGIKRQI